MAAIQHTKKSAACLWPEWDAIKAINTPSQAIEKCREKYRKNSIVERRGIFLKATKFFSKCTLIICHDDDDACNKIYDYMIWRNMRWERGIFMICPQPKIIACIKTKNTKIALESKKRKLTIILFSNKRKENGYPRKRFASYRLSPAIHSDPLSWESCTVLRFDGDFTRVIHIWD